MTSVQQRSSAWNAVESFTQDPVGFMTRNLLLVMASFDNGGIYDITLKPNNTYRVTHLGRSIPVYSVSGSTAGFRTFRAHFCPFQYNNSPSCNLDSNADFMFTVEMNDCSFGIGSADPGNPSARRVAHANNQAHASSFLNTLGPADRSQEQYKLQNQLLKHKLGKDAVLVRPNVYRLDVDGALVLNATTVGLRDTAGGAWSFYVQRFYKAVSQEERETYGGERRIFFRDFGQVG